MISLEDVASALVSGREQITLDSVTAFECCHEWLLEKGLLSREDAIVIILDGASYVLYGSYPRTTVVIKSEGRLKREAFHVLSTATFYGSHGPLYQFAGFVREIAAESWLLGAVCIAIAEMGLLTDNAAMQLLIDKSVDVAAIWAGFLGVFIASRARLTRTDMLQFSKGNYSKYLKVDKYSMSLMGLSVVFLLLSGFFLVVVSSPWYRALVGCLLGTAWWILFAGFRSITRFHVDQIEAESEKEMADEIRKWYGSGEGSRHKK